MQRLTVPFELKSADKKGNFQGFAAKFGNIDLGRDLIPEDVDLKVKAGQNGRLKLALNHNMSKMLGNAAFELKDGGLYVDGNINLKVSYARDAYELMKDGTLDEMSIGYNTLDYAYEVRNKIEIRVLKSIEVWEGSILPFGMNPQAQVMQVKSIKELESQLRELGYSQKEATAIASHGFKGMHRDGGNPNTAMVDQLKALEKTLDTFIN